MKARAKRAVAGFLVDWLVNRSALRQGKRIGGIEPSARDELARLVQLGDATRLQSDIDSVVAAMRDRQKITTALLVSARKKPPRH